MTRDEALQTARETVHQAIQDHDDGGYQFAGLNEIMANAFATALESAYAEGHAKGRKSGISQAAARARLYELGEYPQFNTADEAVGALKKERTS